MGPRPSAGTMMSFSTVMRNEVENEIKYKMQIVYKIILYYSKNNIINTQKIKIQTLKKIQKNKILIIIENHDYLKHQQ